MIGINISIWTTLWRAGGGPPPIPSLIITENNNPIITETGNRLIEE